MNEIRDCPFCGHQPEQNDDDSNATGIWCQNYDCKVRPLIYDKNDEGFAAMKKAWNTRFFTA